MNKQAQLSIDMLFAIFAVLLFIFALQTIVEGMQESQKEIAIRNQELEIANSLREIIVSAQALSDSDKVYVTYEIPELIIPGEAEGQICQIIVMGDAIIVSHLETEVSVRVPLYSGDFLLSDYVRNNLDVPLSTNCGGTFVFGWES